MINRRNAILAAAAILALLLVLLAAGPLLFRGPIERRIQNAIDDRIEARVEWRRAGVSLLRGFPNVTFRLDDLVVTGVDRFEGDTLAAVDRARVELDLGSVLRSLRGHAPVVVREVELVRPRAHLVVLEDGAANWDVLPQAERSPPDSARPLSVSLKGLEVRAGAVRLENRQTNLHAEVFGLRESVNGDFRQRRFTLATRTAADSVSLSFAGVPYLSRARLDIAADLDVDLASRRLTVSENEIRLNELVLRAQGSVGATDDSLALDLAFSAPGNDFSDILSLVPAIYTRSFETLRTAGTMEVSGTVRGGWGEGTFPALALTASVEDGMFQYPDLPLPARDVSLDLTVHNPGGDADSTVVSLERAHVVLGDDPVEGSFVLRTPVTDPDMSVRLNGRIDLADLSRTVKLEGVEELGGVIVADGHMRARRSDVEARRYEGMSAGGGVSVTELALKTEALPHPLRIAEAELELSPLQAELESLRGTIGESDFQGSGRLDNLLGFVLHRQELRGQARVTSRYVALDEWRSDDETRAVLVPANLDFTLQAAADRVTFGALDLRNARGTLRVKDQRVVLDDFGVDMLGGSVTLAGFYETTDPARPTFDLDVEARDLNIASAFEDVRTVQAFAPVARYAQGRVSTDLEARGALGEDFVPVPEALSGLGTLSTMGVVLRDFPGMDRIADALHLDLLRDPALKDFTSTIEIRDGRLHLRPVEVEIGPLPATVSGSNGFDHSLAYTLDVAVPRSLLGTNADRFFASLASQAERTGLDIRAAEVIPVGVRLGGTVTDPSVTTSLRDVAGSAVAGVEQAVRAEAQARVDSARERLDAAEAEARLRARERAIAEAEERAAAIRAEARALADEMKQESRARADSLVAAASGPVARVAAQAAADRILRETDQRAERIVREADARADALVEDARGAAGADTAQTP